MNCWSVLDLPAGADKRSIKRQYAVLLKRHRPDEDPEGFQRLREAYEQALEWADWQQQAQEQEQEQEQKQPSAPQQELQAPPLLDVEKWQQPRQPLDETPHPPPEPVEQILYAELDYPHARPPSEPPQVEGPSPAQLLADQCLDALTEANFDDRLAQARLYDCEPQFEQGLLLYCLAHSEQSELVDRAIAHFQWLTPWQREDLPVPALDRLREQLMERAWVQLAAGTGDSARFLELAKTLETMPWLQTLDGRRWLSERLAMALAQAPVWSQSLFDEISDQQGWKNNHPPCPQPWWSQLQRRSDSHAFLEQQLRLAEAAKDKSAASNAARMLFKPLTPNARVQLSINFSSADWNACEALYQTVQARFPQLLDEVPQLNPDVWRPLRRNPPIMPVPVALIGASACYSWFQEYQLGGTFYGSLLNMLLRVILLGLIACFLAAFSTFVGRRTWRLDNWLNKWFGRWLSLRRPTPLPIRESLWIWLLGAFLLMFGAGVMGTYVVILTLMALWPRLNMSERCASVWSRVRGGVAGEVLLGAFIGMLVPSILLAAALAKHTPLPVNQGMQAWPQRVCAARQLTDDPCPEAFSRSQWYGAQARQEPRP